jgi:outer membrane lipoprotein-sorting protein
MRVNPRQRARIHRVGHCSFSVGVQQTVRVLLLCATALVASAWPQTGTTVPTVETIIARMAQARIENQSRFRPYVVTRGYTLFGQERQKSKSAVMADVTFVPPDRKQYAIQESSGSGLGEMLVRRMLAGEADITKNSGSTDFSMQNYDFRFVRQEDVEGELCYMLELLPKRKDRNLVRGNIWVDVKTYLLRRTEGQPAKSPSWWLRDVRMSFSYGEVSGMWLQTSSEATATVRILGQHTMVMRDMKYTLGELVVAGSTSTFHVDVPVVPATLLDGSTPK